MDWAMQLLRQLRELDEDYAYLTAKSARFVRADYSKIYQELNRRRESLKRELDSQLASL